MGIAFATPSFFIHTVPYLFCFSIRSRRRRFRVSDSSSLILNSIINITVMLAVKAIHTAIKSKLVIISLSFYSTCILPYWTTNPAQRGKFVWHGMMAIHRLIAGQGAWRKKKGEWRAEAHHPPAFLVKVFNDFD